MTSDAFCCLFHNCTNILSKGAPKVLLRTDCLHYIQLDSNRKRSERPLFQLPPGFWRGSGCRPQWPPERVQTWQVAWWETLPQTSTPGKHLQPHTRCPPSSLTGEAATSVQIWGHVIICKQEKQHQSQCTFYVN